MKLRDLRWEDPRDLSGEAYSQPLRYRGALSCVAVLRGNGPYAGTYFLRQTGATFGRRIGPQSMTALELACYLADCEENYEAF